MATAYPVRPPSSTAHPRQQRHPAAHPAPPGIPPAQLLPPFTGPFPARPAADGDHYSAGQRARRERAAGDDDPPRTQRRPAVLRKAPSVGSTEMGLLQRARRGAGVGGAPAAPDTDSSFLPFAEARARPVSSSHTASSLSSRSTASSRLSMAVSAAATLPAKHATAPARATAAGDFGEYSIPRDANAGASFLALTPDKTPQPSMFAPSHLAKSRTRSVHAPQRRETLRLPILSPPIHAVYPAPRSDSVSPVTAHYSSDRSDAPTIYSSQRSVVQVTEYADDEGVTSDIDAIEVLEQMSGLGRLDSAKDWVAITRVYDGSSAGSSDSHVSGGHAREKIWHRYTSPAEPVPARKSFDTRSIRSWRESRKRGKEKPVPDVPVVPAVEPARPAPPPRPPHLAPRLSMSALPAALEHASAAVSMSRSRRRPVTAEAGVRGPAMGMSSAAASPPPIPPQSLSRGLAPRKDRTPPVSSPVSETPPPPMPLALPVPPQKPVPRSLPPALPPIHQRPLPPLPASPVGSSSHGLASTLKSRLRSKRPATANATLYSLSSFSSPPPAPPPGSAPSTARPRSPVVAHIIPPTELSRIVTRRASDSSAASDDARQADAASPAHSPTLSLAPLSPALPSSPRPPLARAATAVATTPTALSPPPRPRGSTAPSLRRASTAPLLPPSPMSPMSPLEPAAPYTSLLGGGTPGLARLRSPHLAATSPLPALPVLPDLAGLGALGEAVDAPRSDWLSQRPRRAGSTPRVATFGA